ncbi:hypothetical protein [Pontibacter pudoricolor]|uniref:hypothetical protein n=1 Tax=Pontibacter pudoricolor TaxID=2694930 RepID=UPI00139143EC|nr:hypothetical protein [Pontibacter pudoricolor]
MLSHLKYPENQDKKLSIVKIEEILKCKDYEDLSYEQALIVAESLKLFCEIIADMYFITGKI